MKSTFVVSALSMLSSIASASVGISASQLMSVKDWNCVIDQQQSQGDQVTMCSVYAFDVKTGKVREGVVDSIKAAQVSNCPKIDAVVSLC